MIYIILSISFITAVKEQEPAKDVSKSLSASLVTDNVEQFNDSWCPCQGLPSGQEGCGLSSEEILKAEDCSTVPCSAESGCRAVPALFSWHIIETLSQNTSQSQPPHLLIKQKKISFQSLKAKSDLHGVAGGKRKRKRKKGSGNVESVVAIATDALSTTTTLDLFLCSRSNSRRLLESREQQQIKRTRKRRHGSVEAPPRIDEKDKAVGAMDTDDDTE
ncbi:hypothetical protein SADUNF_Sadunf13G0042900 [Salix dunnii]|uniref:Uncharacterized protein n=1 Tax=Salix dunnii TaxID=1413687 RepID=A0A835MKR9_9ROSI|nr:hypothetical protein SADUNF_Sadunf13G0042900 [Salix dunnii]